MSRELKRACEEVAVVILTGGLGPTSDDLTREAVAGVAGSDLEYHEEAWAEIQRRFGARRVSDTNRRQCYIPRGFALLPNAHGTAPGFAGSIGSTRVFALPGPPTEMHPMFTASVMGELREIAGVNQFPAGSRETSASIFGVGESALEQGLRECEEGGVSWGTRVTPESIVLTLRGATAEAREATLAELQRRYGAAFVRSGVLSPAEILYTALRDTGATLATAESCTGGLLSAWLTNVPGSSSVYRGGVVAYADEVKHSCLGVDTEIIRRHGAVSAAVAEEMARGAARVCGSDFAVAVTGIAGPSGGSADKPVGTVWIGVVGPSSRTTTEMHSFAGGRDLVRRRAVVSSCLLAESEVLRSTRGS